MGRGLSDFIIKDKMLPSYAFLESLSGKKRVAKATVMRDGVLFHSGNLAEPRSGDRMNSLSHNTIVPHPIWSMESSYDNPTKGQNDMLKHSFFEHYKTSSLKRHLNTMSGSTKLEHTMLTKPSYYAMTEK